MRRNESDECFAVGDTFVEFIEEDSSALLKNVSLALIVLVPIYSIFCLALFLYFRSSHYWLFKRNLTMLLLLWIGGFIALSITAVRELYVSKEFDCALLFFLTEIYGLGLYLPFIARLINVVQRARFNKALIEINFSTVEDGTFSRTVLSGDQSFVQGSIPPSQRESSALVGFNVEKFDNREKLSCFGKVTKYVFFKLFCWTPPTEIPVDLHQIYFWSLYRVTNKVVTVCYAVGVLALVSFLIPLIGCKGCVADEELVFLPVYSSVVALLGIYIFWRTKGSADGLGIKHELKLVFGIAVVLQLTFIPLSIVFDTYEKDGIFSWSLFLNLQHMLILTVAFPYQVYLAIKNSQTANEDKATFYDVIEDNEGSKAFALFLASILCVENLFFYKAVQHWKKKFKESSETEREVLKRNIFEKFVKNDAVFTISVYHKTRSALTARMDEETTEDMYDAAMREVIRLISSDVFHKFQNSVYYQAYIGNVDPNDL